MRSLRDSLLGRRQGREPALTLLESQIEQINKFPDQNPNPVLRLAADGTLMYANAASAPILASWGLAVGDKLPAVVRAQLRAAAAASPPESIEVASGRQTFAILAVPVPGFDFLNLYGTEITAAKAIDRFPGGNPNPVLRMSPEGVLLYGNDASEPITRALGLRVGDQFPAALHHELVAACVDERMAGVEIRAGDRTYSLTPVLIPEYGFINVYGTDMTAARAIEEANRENERLLLNILPASIAQRLKAGEAVIADHFDDLTVLFADVVDFTPLSAKMPPVRVVELLNRVFSAYDVLAERHGLEKIKTIGDAYMAVGGLTGDAAGCTERVATMGLEMIKAVEDVGKETSTGLRIRVGMHVGPAVAGVIGIRKFIYDVWGDTVNTASRMESSGVPGRVQVTGVTYERLGPSFDFESRGSIDVKGLGTIPTYLVVGPRA
jgi:class 3 adenylate cyclase